MIRLSPFLIWKGLNKGLSLYRKRLERDVSRLQKARLPKEAEALERWGQEVRAEGDIPMCSPPGLWRGRDLNEVLSSHGELFIAAAMRAQIKARIDQE